YGRRPDVAVAERGSECGMTGGEEDALATEVHERLCLNGAGTGVDQVDRGLALEQRPPRREDRLGEQHGVGAPRRARPGGGGAFVEAFVSDDLRGAIEYRRAAHALEIGLG